MIKQITFEGLLISYLLLLIVLGISYFERLRLEKDILVSFIRMSLQLFAAGFVLSYVFVWDKTILNMLIYLLMIYFASRIVVKRAGVNFSGLSWYIFLSILLSSFAVLVVMLFGVVGLESLNARYFIVLAGMIVGNSMNSTTIGIERFFSSYKDSKGRIEDLLCLGATEEEALKFIGRSALKASILPSLASASGMGIVFLPGMMTGQILSGVNPNQAVFYQISIVAAITTTVCLSNYFMVKTLTKKWQKI
ncbi:ABC transporter permease [Hippea alviniae]|uniref:ABC transporter permease n=1 Tax=Hippea alviniae TaxID=1279027 RepID=UPI0003B6F88B|nr:iron export ABC transporter permease subunit FetB [Hippea alviniae]